MANTPSAANTIVNMLKAQQPKPLPVQQSTDESLLPPIPRRDERAN
jgi:hypothetical protein